MQVRNRKQIACVLVAATLSVASASAAGVTHPMRHRLSNASARGKATSAAPVHAVSGVSVVVTRAPGTAFSLLTAKQRRAFRKWVRLVAIVAYLDALWRYTHEPWDWYAIASCETGGDWNVVGSRYSTGLGMMNQAIRENSPPDVAQRELSGHASVIEIVGTARTIAYRHGIHSWGCGKALYP